MCLRAVSIARVGQAEHDYTINNCSISIFAGLKWRQCNPASSAAIQLRALVHASLKDAISTMLLLLLQKKYSSATQHGTKSLPKGHHFTRLLPSVRSICLVSQPAAAALLSKLDKLRFIYLYDSASLSGDKEFDCIYFLIV